jgi:hypothetical protein
MDLTTVSCIYLLKATMLRLDCKSMYETFFIG